MSAFDQEIAAEWDRALGSSESAATLGAEFGKRLAAEGLAFGTRPICRALRPLFLRASAYERLVAAGEALLFGLHELARDPGLPDRLGLSQSERDLIALDPSDTPPDALGRLDAFFDENGQPRFIEYNAESPGGMAFGDALGALFEETPPWQRIEDHVHRLPVLPRVLTALLENWKAWAGRHGLERTQPKGVAIVDFREAATSREFEICRETFVAAGIPTRVIDPEELELSAGGQLSSHGFEIDLVYRRVLTSDVLAHRARCTTLIEAARRDAAAIANGFGGHFLSHKGLLAELSTPETQPQTLSGEQVALIDRALPWTRWARDPRAPGLGAQDLESTVLERRESLVLKPVSAYGGEGVVLGWETEESVWRQAWRNALDEGNVIVQQRTAIPRLTFPNLEGLSSGSSSVDVGPYVFNGKYLWGAGVRISEGDLLNVTAGQGSALPLIITTDRA